MAEISRLPENFQEHEAPKELAPRLRSESIRPGPERLVLIVDAGGGTLGFERWTPPQIEAVVSEAKLIVSALRSSSVGGHVESVVVPILKKSLEFCIDFLQKLEYEGGDFGLQVRFLDRVWKSEVVRLVKSMSVFSPAFICSSTEEINASSDGMTQTDGPTRKNPGDELANLFHLRHLSLGNRDIDDPKVHIGKLLQNMKDKYIQESPTEILELPNLCLQNEQHTVSRFFRNDHVRADEANGLIGD